MGQLSGSQASQLSEALRDAFSLKRWTNFCSSH